MATKIRNLALTTIALLLVGAAAPAGAAMAVLVEISGHHGPVTQPGWDGWLQARSAGYTLPGMPSPAVLRSRPQSDPSGELLGPEITNPAIRIDRDLDASSGWLGEAQKQGQRIRQIKLALVETGASPFFAFTLHGVSIAKITRQGQRETLEVRFDRLAWVDFRVAGHGSSDMPIWD